MHLFYTKLTKFIMSGFLLWNPQLSVPILSIFIQFRNLLVEFILTTFEALQLISLSKSIYIRIILTFSYTLKLPACIALLPRLFERLSTLLSRISFFRLLYSALLNFDELHSTTQIMVVHLSPTFYSFCWVKMHQ